ncbi:MAG TPA: molybdopterin-dependent oxidoreductase [Stellaceae bacterium]|nr:molybdopterin-dependent oxidoreductase [Stellaceae bacterium]
MTQTFARNHSHYGAFTAIVEDGRVVGVRPFEHDPDPSQLIEAIPDAVHSPTRIAQPMVREGWLRHGPGSGAGRGSEDFVPVSWDKALDLVAGELARVKSAHGNASIMGGSQGWSSAGLFHEARVQVRRFLSSFGGFTDQASNYSFGAALTFLPHILGSPQAVSGPVTSWSSIAKHTRLMVMFGGANPKNTQVAKGGCAYHAISGWIEQLNRAGVAIVNISPMREDGPGAVAPEWIAIRPNTDTAMMLALAHTLVTENLHDRDFLARYCTGFERVLPYLMGATDGVAKDAGWASRITAVPADTIRDLARRMAASRTMLTASWSLQRADHGEQPYWALVLLASLLGQVGLPGGGFGFGYGSSGNIAEPPLQFPGPAMEALRNPAGLAIPCARIADCLLQPGGRYDYDGKSGTYPDIRLVYWAGGNPFHHHQDLNRLRRAWRRPETVVVHEPWWTATARHADIVLPATTSLERNDLGCAARDRFVIAMHKAIPPVGEARDDFSILRDLSQRLGCENAFTEGRDEDGWVRRIYDVFRERARSNLVPEFDEFWEKGWLEIPRRGEEYVLMEDFRADPERHRLHTPSGKIELYSERIAGFGYDDCPPHPTWIEPAEWLGSKDAGEYPLHLVSSQPRYRLHSQMDAGPVSALGKIDGREAVALNRADARVRGIAPGDVVRVYNDRGACFAGAVLSDDVRPGVVKLSCGAWYDPESGADDAACAHGNANVLTRDHGTSRLGQGPSSATALVEVERWSGDAPPVRAFVPPESNQGRPA